MQSGVGDDLLREGSEFKKVVQEKTRIRQVLQQPQSAESEQYCYVADLGTAEVDEIVQKYDKIVFIFLRHMA